MGTKEGAERGADQNKDISAVEEDRFQILAGQICEALVLANAEGRIEYVNRAFVDMFGYSEAEASGMNLFKLVHISDRKAIRDRFKMRVSGHSMGGKREFAARNKAGDPFPVLASARLRIAGGKLLGIQVLMRDLTADKEHERHFAVLKSAEDVSEWGLAMVDRQGRFAYVSRSFADMFGHESPKSLVGKSWKKQYEPEWVKLLTEETFPRAIESGRMVARVVGRRKDGTPFEQELDLARGPEPGSVTMIVRDLTDAKQVELELREARALFMSLVEQMPRMAILGLGSDGTVKHWNRAAEALYGLGADTAVGRNIQELPIPSDRLDVLERDISVAWNWGTSSERTVWALEHGDGGKSWVMSSIFPVKIQGKVTEVFLVDMDITEERLSARALRKSEERMRFILEGMPGVYFYVHDAKTLHFKYISPNIEDTLGYEPEFFNKPHKTILTDNPINREARKVAEKILYSGGRAGTYRHEVYDREGRRRLLETVEKAVLDEKGEVAEICGLVMDVTRRQAMEEEIRSLQRRELIESFSRAVLEQVKSPFEDVHDALKSLEKRTGHHKELRSFLDLLERRSKVVHKLLRSLDILGKDVAEPPVSLELSAVCRDVIEKMAREEETRGIEVTLDVPAAGLRLMGSLNAIRRAVHQLLENAVAFSPPGAQVNLTLTQAGDWIQISVRDLGKGVPPELQEKIFQPFFSTREDGVGLGLPFVERVAIYHGGRVDVYNNTPDPGCTFNLWIPVRPREEFEKSGNEALSSA